jgi:hypothetical protein
MIQQRGVKPPIYKSGQFRKYTMALMERAMEDLSHSLMLASLHPSHKNRRNATLASVARRHHIEQMCLRHYVTWKTEHE